MNEIVITHQELKIGGIALIFSVIFVFAGGYFLGKKQALEEQALYYEDECFAEKIQQSLSLFCDQAEPGVEEEGETD